MGLGSLLLNGNQATARLQRDGNETLGERFRHSEAISMTMPAPLMGAPDQTTGTAAQQSPPGESADEAHFVILYPALGCPGLVAPDSRCLDIMLLCKQTKDQLTVESIRQLLQSIRVLPWSAARRPYCEDGQAWSVPANSPSLAQLVAVSDGIRLRTQMALSEYQTTIKERPWQFGNLLHTIADIVPTAYLQKGFQSIVSIEVTLQDSPDLSTGEMFTLFYEPENGLLWQILQDGELLKKPYDDIPVMTYKDNSSIKTSIGGHNRVYRWRDNPQGNPSQSRCGDRPREHQVRLFHPFRILPAVTGEAQASPYLNVGHLTDLHLSSLWDFFDEKLFPSYHQDNPIVVNQGQVQGRNPTQDADSRFEAIATRFNNPNLNVRNLTQQLNQLTNGNQSLIDVILHTGDLIDFNRGFNLKSTHDPDRDYIFNLNWIRYYELLLLDYERPTFTLIGNHDWRLNPYPPRIKVDKSLLLYLIPLGALAGAACGPIFGAFEQAMKDKSSKWLKILLQLLVSPFAGSLSFYVFLLLLGGIGIDFDTIADTLGQKWFPVLGIGWLLGLSIAIGLVLIAELTEKLENTGEGTLWGLAVGTGVCSLVALIIAVFFSLKWDYMTRITNLLGKDFADLLDNKNVEYLDVFGKDGILHMSDRAFDWYALTINPFAAYALRYGNTSILMANWEGSEILPQDPPVADDSLTDRQWALIQQWVEWLVDRRNQLANSDQQVVPILGMHTPVFCPMVEVNLNNLNQQGMAADNSDLERGTLEEHRKDLINLFFQLSQGTYPGISKPIPAISLTGHTHTYDVFQMPEANKVVWYQIEHLSANGQLKNEFKGKGLHITTCCSGPPGDDLPPEGSDEEKLEARQRFKQSLKDYDARKDSVYDGTPIAKFYQPGSRVLRPAGGRVLIFDRTTGQLSKIDEISAQTAKWGDS